MNISHFSKLISLGFK